MTVSWNWRRFWDSNSWMLFILDNGIERTFAVIAAGVALSGGVTARYLDLLQKHCFVLGCLALRFCSDIIFWKYPHKKVEM